MIFSGLWVKLGYKLRLLYLWNCNNNQGWLADTKETTRYPYQPPFIYVRKHATKDIGE